MEANEPTSSGPLPEPGLTPKRAVVCPYCGQVNGAGAKECERCKGLFEPLSRQASQNAMGPWFIRDEGNPFRPGCSYETLKMLVVRKRVTGETILRGPTTRQFWMAARSVPGVAHLLGECHACHKQAEVGASKCWNCGASFAAEEDRQFLGLAEVRMVPVQGVSVKKGSGKGKKHHEPKREDVVSEEIVGTELVLDYDPAAEVVNAPATEAYEPVRHPARAVRGGGAMSDAQIDEMLRRERAETRGPRVNSVLIGLIAMAVLGIGLVVMYGVFIVQGAAKNAGAAGSGGGSGSAPVVGSGVAPAVGKK